MSSLDWNLENLSLHYQQQQHQPVWHLYKYMTYECVIAMSFLFLQNNNNNNNNLKTLLSTHTRSLCYAMTFSFLHKINEDIFLSFFKGTEKPFTLTTKKEARIHKLSSTATFVSTVCTINLSSFLFSLLPPKIKCYRNIHVSMLLIYHRPMYYITTR